jgi:hypothetical protein
MKLNNKSAPQIAKWLSDKGRKMQCPCCQKADWSTSEDIHFLTCPSGKSSSRPLVTLRCLNCAFLVFYDAASIGIEAE